MDDAVQVRRLALVLVVVTLGVATSVYFFNDWMEAHWLPALGVSRSAAAAMGSAVTRAGTKSPVVDASAATSG